MSPFRYCSMFHGKESITFLNYDKICLENIFTFEKLHVKLYANYYYETVHKGSIGKTCQETRFSSPTDILAYES